MFNKIIKIGQRKPSKSESGSDVDGTIPSVTVNHASRGGQVSNVGGRSSEVCVPTTPPPGTIQTLPMFKDVPAAERQGLFLKKVQMTTSIADELYSEILEQSNGEVGSKSTSLANHFNSSDSHEDDLWIEDGLSWNGSNNESEKESDLDREWQRRRDQFHTIGYRDGLMAGKEASAQEGFNTGFSESVFVGYKWGLVRGVSSALACLPDEVKKRLVESEEQRNKFIHLHDSVNGLSTSDALKLFHDDMSNSVEKQKEHPMPTSLKEKEHASGRC